MKTLKRTGVALGILLVAIQVIRPARTNPDVDPAATIQARTHMTLAVNTLLERSCNDCHSSTTRWPWYSELAPASWLVARDVNEARRKLSLSEWGRYDEQRARRKLDAMCDEVRKGGMPIKSYLLMHSAAALTETDRRLLCEWIRAEQVRIETEPR